MIQLEYDERTSGVRVSFVVRDKEMSTAVDDHLALHTGGRHIGAKWELPQNNKTLDAVKILLDHAREI